MLEITVNEIGINNNIGADLRGNFYTSYKSTIAGLPALVLESWHLREQYYCEDLFRVPVPPTLNGKFVFFTAISKIGDLHLTPANPIASPLDSNYYIADVKCVNEGRLLQAKFAEIIIASHDWLCKWGKPATAKPYEIINYRGLPKKNVPNIPLEIVKAIKLRLSPHYTLTDLADSVEFWSHHCFIRI